METISTARGKIIHLTHLQELWDVHTQGGESIRAYCHVHRGDHQRSLSIHKSTGWGRCFQCQALVLIEEYNPATAADLREKRPHTAIIEPPPVIQPEPAALPARKHTKGEPWQQEEIAALHALGARLCGALGDVELGDAWQAQAYLLTRGISLEGASEAGVGYLPRYLLNAPDMQPHHALLSRWTERLLFPLRSPTGNGFIGRSLWRWQVGMDENIHKALLEQEVAPRRWIKTNPAGWFCVPPVDFSASVILVEGSFDRLALLEAGFAPGDVVALVGTAARADWFPPQVRGVVLALDADAGGLQALDRLIEELEAFEVVVCPPPEDHLGKDWSERWRKVGQVGVAPLFAAFAQLQHLVHEQKGA